MSKIKIFLIMIGSIVTALTLLIGIFVLQFHIRKTKDLNAKLMTQKTNGQNENKVLKAEWSYLTQIENLRKLSKKHLSGYETISNKKIKKIEELH